MSFTGFEDHLMPLQEAAELTANYRNSEPLGVTLGHYFSKSALLDILNQPSCVGVRIYYGLDNQNEKKLIIVGTDANENDLTDGQIAQHAKPCPPSCGTPNPLNS